MKTNIPLNSHTLEDLFNIPANTTQSSTSLEIRKTELVVHSEYDDKDAELEHQYQEIADLALTAYDNHLTKTEQLFGKLYVDSQEASSALLNTALNAIKEKSSLKKHKDKMLKPVVQAPTTNTVTNIIMDRNELLKNMMDQNRIYDADED